MKCSIAVLARNFYEILVLQVKWRKWNCKFSVLFSVVAVSTSKGAIILNEWDTQITSVSQVHYVHVKLNSATSTLCDIVCLIC